MTYCDETIALRGRQTRVLRGGKGRPLLYLHDAWAPTWLPVHDRLAERYEVICPIHPGFEGSNGLEDIDSMEDLVLHYLDLLEVLQLEQPVLMGASLGGWLAAEFAVRYAGMLRALILIDALGLRVPGAPAADVFQLDAIQTRAVLFADPSSPTAYALVPDVPAQEALLAMLKARRAFAHLAWQFPDNPKLTGYLYRVKCPTLVMWGERDGVVPGPHGQLYHTEIAAAEFVVVPACGHLPHIEQPEAVATTVLNFLEGGDRTPMH